VRKPGLTRPRRLGKPLGNRGSSRERLHKQPCKGEQLKTANQTPAVSPTGQDEQERTRQHAETRRGAFDRIYRIYRIYKIASSGELKIDCRKAARREQHRGRCKSICRILTADRRAFALRMGRVKIPHSTCEHDRVRLFYPPLS
jgi:hypothetical protein